MKHSAVFPLVAHPYNPELVTRTPLSESLRRRQDHRDPRHPERRSVRPLGGIGYTATEVSANPKPGYVPIWIGGNSALTRRRVASVGDGRHPFVAPPALAKTTRTTPLETLDDLAPPIADLHRQYGTDVISKHG